MRVGGGRPAGTGAGASGRVHGSDAHGRPHHGGRPGHHRVGHPTRLENRSWACDFIRCASAPARNASSELRNERVPLRDVRGVCPQRRFLDRACGRTRVGGTAGRNSAGSLPLLSHVTGRWRRVRPSPMWRAKSVGRTAPAARHVRVWLRPGNPATHPAVPARDAPFGRGTAVNRGGQPRWVCRPAAPSPRGARPCGRAAGVVASGFQQCEQIDPIAVRVGDRRIAHAPWRVIRCQRPTMPCGRDLLEQRIDLRR